MLKKKGLDFVKAIIGKPRRLPVVFCDHGAPIFFVTAVTANRDPILSSDPVHTVLREHASENMKHGRAMGRYVIMPDHVHFFVRLPGECKLSDYVRWMKFAVTRVLRRDGGTDRVWQAGFFDHALRSTESYAQKWEYVRMNPVRAGLVSSPDEWPYQGEIQRIEM
jgi:REP element-mobilizing transposase RayT